MNIAYLLPILPPKEPRAEALSQEIAAFRQAFGGTLSYVNPNRHLPVTLIPRLLFGWSDLLHLRRIGHTADLYHFFNPDPFPFPFLLTLPRPVVYTVTGGLDIHAPRPNLAFLRRMAVVAVPDERTLAQLQQWGLTNVALQRPGVDTARIHPRPLALPPGDPLRLLVASAPWTPEQFVTKGFDALLATAQQRPDLHLTLLWRGLLRDEIERRVHQLGLAERVCIIDRTVDVDDALANVHAAALLPTRPGLVKAYPHSLLDALAGGKPVLVSPALPMADYVAQTGCGLVVDAVTPAAIGAALDQLRLRYPDLVSAARTVGPRDFTLAQAEAAAATIYARACGDRP
jgi:glycosyltransferase involved in cell wall biosynthesis